MSCKCTTYSSTPPALCNAGCIIGGRHLVQARDSVGNCGQVGTIDLGALAITARNNTTCGAAVFFTVEKYETIGFEFVSVVGNILSYMFKTTTKKNDYYKVQGRTICPITGRADFYQITIGVKDMCALVNCGNGEECSPCTGGCVAVTPDISTI